MNSQVTSTGFNSVVNECPFDSIFSCIKQNYIPFKSMLYLFCPFNSCSLNNEACFMFCFQTFLGPSLETLDFKPLKQHISYIFDQTYTPTHKLNTIVAIPFKLNVQTHMNACAYRHTCKKKKLFPPQKSCTS